MYYNPRTGGGYSHPGRQKIYVKRLGVLNQLFGPAGGQTVCIVGCGFGYLNLQMTLDGWVTWGVDAAQYSLDRGAAEVALARVTLADIVTATPRDIRRDAGLTGQARFDLCVSEDLLPCLRDDEVTAAVENMRELSGTVAHIVTCKDLAQPEGTYMSAADLHDDGQDPLNWKTASEWKQLVGGDTLIEVGRYEVVT